MWLHTSLSILAERLTLLRRTVGLVALSAVPLLPAHAQVRPKVTLEVAIDSAPYRRWLGDPTCTNRCARLLAMLLEPTRAALQRRFGFLDWRATPASSPDTIRVIWTTGPTIPDAKLSFTVLGREQSARARPYAAAFESYARIRKYPGPVWLSADSVARRWLAQLDVVLRDKPESQAIVSEALSHIALRPDVSLDAMKRATVGLDQRAIRADPTAPPLFLVRLDVEDLLGARRDTTDASLWQCGPARGTKYGCDVRSLVYPHRNPVVTIADTAVLTQLARHARSRPVTLHVLSFTADTNDNGPIHKER